MLVEPIAYIESPYKEKFAIPRQPGLVVGAKGKVIFTPAYNQVDLVKGLENFSHIWLLFNFHATEKKGWKPLVRPPRLGGNEKMGVLATRSTFRPNAIGMSVVKLDSVVNKNKQLALNISALDLLHGTPIIDIKPYIPYSDAITDAQASFANAAPVALLQVKFSPSAQQQVVSFDHKYPGLAIFITEVLGQDPRPAYKKNTVDEKIYGVLLYDLNIKWQLSDLTTIEVISITPSTS